MTRFWDGRTDRRTDGQTDGVTALLDLLSPSATQVIKTSYNNVINALLQFIIHNTYIYPPYLCSALLFYSLNFEQKKDLHSIRTLFI